MVTVLGLIQGLLGAVEVLDAANTLGGLLKGPPASPLQRAVEQTASRYQERFPDLRRQLQDAMASARVREALRNLIDVGTSSEEDAALVLARTGLFLPTPEDEFAALEVVRYFLSKFNEEVLRAPVGLVVHDVREAERHASTIGELREVRAAVERIEAAHTLQPAERLRAFREKASKLPKTAASALFELLQDELRQTGGWTREIAGQLFTEMGSIAWRTGDEQAARKWFERAFEENPADTRAELNSALALALAGDFALAITRAEAVLGRDPTNIRALATKAQVLHMQRRNSDVLALLRPATGDYHSDSDLVRLRIAACIQEGLHDEAVEVAERCLRSLDGVPEQTSLALAHATRAESQIRLGKYTATVRADLTAASTAFAAVVASQDGERFPRERLEALINGANVRMALGDLNEALRLARTAHALAGTDPRAALTLAAVAIGAGEPDEAFRVAEPLALAGDAQAKTLAIGAYAAMNEGIGLDKITKFMGKVGVQPDSAEFILFTQLLSAAIAESPAMADTLVANWKVGGPAQRALASARVAFAQGEPARGADLLDAALEALRDASEPSTLFALANVANANGLPDAAARALEALGVNAASPDVLVNAYLSALLGLPDGESRILHFAEDAKAAGTPLPSVLHAEATVRERQGELEAAQALWMQLSEMLPDVPAYVAASARCAYRRGRLDDATAALAKLDRSSGLRSEELLLVAELRRRLGQYEDALRDAYKALEGDPHDPSVAVAFLALSSAIPDSEKLNLVPAEVKEGVVVALEFERAPRHHVVIAARPVPFDATRYAPDSDVARLLRGKKVGDAVEWSRGAGGVTAARVAELYHPYRFAAAMLFAGVPHRYPGQAPIRSIPVGDNFEGLRQELQKQQAHQDKIVELAKTQPTPIATVAKAVGRDLFRTWSSLEALGLTVLARTGTPQDDARERAALASCKIVVPDAVTLLDLRLLGLLARIRERFPRILVAQQVYDEIAEARDGLREDRARGDLLTVSLERGEMVKTVVTAEQLDSAISFLSDILAFCDKYGERVGRGRPLSERERQLAEIAGEGAVAPIIVAGTVANDGGRLFSTEFVMRVLARELTGAEGFGVLAFMAAEADALRMPLTEYSDAQRICLRRMRHVPITPRYLTFLVCELRPIAEYIAAVEALLNPDADRMSTLLVAALHIRSVAIETAVWEAAIPYLEFLFGRILARFGGAALGTIRAFLTSPKLVVVPSIERAVRMLEAYEKR